jgi:hypothetical protein
LYDYPTELSLSEDGVYSGTPLVAYNAEEITFKVTDNNFISSWKTLQLSGNGIVVIDSVSSGGNQVIEFGETVWQSVMVTNIEDQAISNATMQIFIDDPYVILNDSTEDLGTLPVGVTLRFIDAFTFDISPEVPDNHLIEIATEITSDTNTWNSNLSHLAYSPVISVAEALVDDNNNRLDPGDTADIKVTLINSGGAAVTGVYAMLTSNDPAVTIHTGLANIAYFAANSSEEVVYNVSIDDDVLNGHVITFVENLTGDQAFTASDTFDLAVGAFQENFETGDFSQFDWGCTGSREWHMDPEMAYEGVFSAKSGAITHSEESVLVLDLTAQTDGNVSFYSMVSCEDDTISDNYDYLAFFIDGMEQGRWDGQTNWEYHEFPLEEGYHRLEWKYNKDISTSTGYDAAWVDLISFPAPLSAGPDLSYDPANLEITFKPDELDYDTIYLTNSGPGDVSFEIDIAGIEPGSRFPVAGSQFPSPSPRFSIADGHYSGGRSMAGSTLVSDGEKVHTGKAYTWELRTYCASFDNEWTKDIYLEINEGIELTTAGNFEGGSGGPLQFMGPLGNGVTSHWHGEDANGWGVIHPGETATADITFYLHDYLAPNAAIYYEIHGDIYGATPHVVYGELPVRNLGPEIEWLSVETNEGTIAGGITIPVVLNINTEGMEDGTYQAWILISDNHFNEFVIPVNLVVDTYLGVEDPLGSRPAVHVYPNPFFETINFSFLSETKTTGSLNITNAMGSNVYSESLHIAKGENLIIWDGKDNGYQVVANGIYFGKISFGNQVYLIKMVKRN